MMNRRFTTRETTLLIICAAILLGIFYYKFVYVYTVEAANMYDTTSLQDEFSIVQMKAAKMQQMKKEIENEESGSNGEVVTYDNLDNEIKELNDVLSGADTYNLQFNDPTLTGQTVRRNVSVAFHTKSYASAKSIVSRLSSCRYRCMIKDMNIATTSSQSVGIESSGDLNVSFTVTFYETVMGATTEEGLIEIKEETPAEEEAATEDTTQATK